MTVPGLPLADQLPRPHPSGTTSILLLGGGNREALALRRAGYRVDRHALDPGPLAQLRGIPFTPPVVAWPQATASYDAVILLDELAVTVREEEALAEAARVVRPGGILVLRVPAAGRIAWLDGFNAYRYVRDISRRGRPLPETAGVGWRRHYARRDLRDLLRPHFRVRAMRASGIGLSDAARLALMLFWRWLLCSPRGEAAIRRVPGALARCEGRWALVGRGYWLVVAAERRAET